MAKVDNKELSNHGVFQHLIDYFHLVYNERCSIFLMEFIYDLYSK